MLLFFDLKLKTLNRMLTEIYDLQNSIKIAKHSGGGGNSKATFHRNE